MLMTWYCSGIGASAATMLKKHLDVLFVKCLCSFQFNILVRGTDAACMHVEYLIRDSNESQGHWTQMVSNAELWWFALFLLAWTSCWTTIDQLVIWDHAAHVTSLFAPSHCLNIPGMTCDYHKHQILSQQSACTQSNIKRFFFFQKSILQCYA